MAIPEVLEGREYDKFDPGIDGRTVVRTRVIGGISVALDPSLFGPPSGSDFINHVVNPLTDLYEFFVGGPGGVLKRRVTLTWFDEDKEDFSTVLSEDF